VRSVGRLDVQAPNPRLGYSEGSGEGRKNESAKTPNFYLPHDQIGYGDTFLL